MDDGVMSYTAQLIKLYLITDVKDSVATKKLENDYLATLHKQLLLILFLLQALMRMPLSC